MHEATVDPTQSGDRLTDTSAQLFFIWSRPHAQNMMMPTFRMGLLNLVNLTKIILPQALLEAKVIEITPHRVSYNFLSYDSKFCKADKQY